MNERGRHSLETARDPETARNREGGTVLVLAALLFIGVFGMLGVVIDGGRLRVTQQQMEAGAESAALEGVRFRASGDGRRREIARRALLRQWDDDLRPENGDRIGLGAGTLPIVQGATPVGGRIVVPVAASDRVWKPGRFIETNVSNARHGDFVAGRFSTNVIQPPEDDTFVRSDFLPTLEGSPVADFEESPSFLVRLRRASNRLALDRQPGESSAGPPFEWLWARGSAWQEPGAGDDNQSRDDGLTVRATAIAGSEPALVVTGVPELGVFVAPFALRVDPGAAWQTSDVGQVLVVDRDPTDNVLRAAGAEEGVVTGSRSPRRVGELVVLTPIVPLGALSTELVVPVYAQVAGSPRVAVGFTRASVSVTGDTLSITRLNGIVLPTGSSSASPVALDARVALVSTPGLRASRDSVLQPILAPVVRR